MKTRYAVACLCLCLLAALSVSAQNSSPGSLLVLSKRDHTLAIVDPSNLRVVARVPVGSDPHEVIASADGHTAYVSNYGFGAFNTLAVVDLVKQQALPSIDLGPLRGPHGLAFAGDKLWFTAEVEKVVARYDPQTKKVDWILGTGQNRTHMVFVSPDLQTIITTNVNSATVSIIEKNNTPAPLPPAAAGMAPPPGSTSVMNWDETVLPVGKGSEGFDVSPDGREIWVANAQDGTISIIDRAGKKVTQTLASNTRGANRLKFTLDGKLVFVSSLGGPDVVVIDPATRQEVKRVPVGRGAAGILMHPDGSRVYVACTPDNYVAVIDIKTLTVTGHIDAGGNPDGLAWATHP